MSDQTQMPTPPGRHSGEYVGAHRLTGPPVDPGPAPARPRTGWGGWIVFAGLMMIFLGVWNTIDGLLALGRSDYYAVAPAALLLFDLSTWGVILLVVGIVQIAAGCSLFSGAGWARVVTVLVAGLNAVVQLAFLAAYPFGATLIMVVGFLVVWAVVVHGDELARSGVGPT